MRILVLGGTVFLGRHFCEAALAAGHTLTLFHRGRHNPDLFPGVERILGERDGGLDPLRGRRWEAVIDTCGYVPRIVRASAELLAGATDLYLFVSSLSVFSDFSHSEMDEDGPLATLADPATEVVDADTYGGLKVLCERSVEELFGPRACIVRPGLIVGPHDPTDRFTYWVERIASGGEVLAPGRPDRRVQVIDGRDLAEWMLRLATTPTPGVFNAVGPPAGVAMGELLDAARAASGSDAVLRWVDESFLVEEKVTPWSELPVWIPESDPSMAGFFRFDVLRAVTSGLRFRPIVTTVRDTHAWCATLPADRARRAGMAPERERELLAKARTA